MAKQVYWLRDAEWRRIEPLLPRGRRGAHRVDDRRVISGIVHMSRCGALAGAIARKSMARLPAYARPLFLRIKPTLDTTDTFKQKNSS